MLRLDLGELKRHYAIHIHVEEEQILPTAAKALTTSQLGEMGAEMRARRGLNVGSRLTTSSTEGIIIEAGLFQPVAGSPQIRR